MFGTIARFQLKPGTQARLFELLRNFESANIDGYTGQYVYRSDRDPNEYYLAVIFRDRESYMANAHSPEQDRRYRQLTELFVGEPEWHDGEIVFSTAYESTAYEAEVASFYGGWENMRAA